MKLLLEEILLALVEPLQDADLSELEVDTRKRLYGHRATKRQWVNKVLELSIGDPTRRIRPMTQQEISQELAISREWVSQIQETAIKYGLVQQTHSGKLKIPDVNKESEKWLRLEKDPFRNDPDVKPWVDDMLVRKNGEPIKDWSAHMRNLRNICNTLKIKPKQLIITQQITENYWRSFLQFLKEDRVQFTNKNRRPSRTIEHARKKFVDALRNFCGFHHMNWGRGMSNLMSAKVVGHGKYAHIRLSVKELEEADKYLIHHYGQNSDQYRLFWIGVESCARDKALFGMKCEWEEIEDEDGIIFVMKVYESKTKHIRNGIWDKFIMRKQTQASLIYHKSKKNLFAIWCQKDSKSDRINKNKLAEDMRLLWQHLGKIPNLQQLYDDRKANKPTSDNFFFEKPIHAMRHIGAQELLRITNWDYGLVAELGGWNTIDELKKSYGEMPPEVKMKKIREVGHRQ